MKVGVSMNYFMKPLNLEMWNMFEKVTSVNHIECFLATNDMRKGDILFLHLGSQVSKYKSGIYAVGEIISNPYILHNSPENYCNEKNTVDVKILKIDYHEPLIIHEDCVDYINQFRTAHRLIYENGTELYNKIFNTKIDTSYNKKRVETKDEWIDILKAEKQDNNVVLEVLFYMMQCKNYTSNGLNIMRALNLNGIPNLDIARFGKRIVELKKIDEQKGDNGDNRYWNIPFETDFTKNRNGIFTWKIRPELVDALIEYYGLNKVDSNNALFEETLKDFDPKEYEKSIKDVIDTQTSFVQKFNITKIMNMTLDEYVIGKVKVDDSGLNSFCYILERKLRPLGSMLGATSSKFGIWYAPEEGTYKTAKK